MRFDGFYGQKLKYRTRRIQIIGQGDDDEMSQRPTPYEFLMTIFDFRGEYRSDYHVKLHERSWF